MFENYVKINKEIKALALENKYYFYTLIWRKKNWYPAVLERQRN